MPAWPLGTTFTKGLLHTDQRQVVEASLEQATLARDVWTRKIEGDSFAAVQSDPRLMAVVRQSGRSLFGDNCAVCHGLDAKGGKGFPNLTTTSWLWGGTPEAVFETIRVGINSTHPKTRVSQMPAFGRDQMIPRADVLKVATFVHSLSSPNSGTDDPKVVEAGKAIFAANCVSCHGADAKGNPNWARPT